MQNAVHQLWPPPGDMRKTEMNILFFHSSPRDPDEWKNAWTQRGHPDVCWPEKWLPADLGFDVRVLFVSYIQSGVAVVVDDLFKALVIRDEWDLCKNHQPLVLVGRDFGTLVLDSLFLKATEEVLTSPTQAGAFVRNVRGVTLYGDEDKSYRIGEFFGRKLESIERVRTFDVNYSLGVSMTQGSTLINPAIYGKNLTRDVLGLDPCQWIRETMWGPSRKLDPEVRWKPESKESRSYTLLLESCRMVYKFEAMRTIFEHLLQKLDNIITACDISNYSDSMFENEFTYLRRNGIEGVKILIVQHILAKAGVDVEQHMVAKKSDDDEQFENERKLAILKFTVARFCESHEWHMVPEMKESAMRHKVESNLDDVVHEISPLSDDVVNEKMHRERISESRYYPGWEERERERNSRYERMSSENSIERRERERREALHRDNDTVPINFPSIREQSIMSVKQLQQLACNMQCGENLRQEDVQEQLTAHMAQALHGGKLIVTAKILEGEIQFLFGNAKSMAEIVGVGLDFATVSLTRQNVIVVEGITELEWTRLWGEVFLGESLFEKPIFMEKVVISPPDREKPQGSHVNALSTVAMFFMIQKFLQNLDVGKVYNQVVRGAATTLTEENQSDIGQVHAKNVNDPSTGILGLNLWAYLTRGCGSATRDPSGVGGSRLGGADTPNEGDNDQGGDGGEDDDNQNGRGVKGKKIQQNNQRNVPSKGILEFNWWDYFPRLQITWQLGSATRDAGGEGICHLEGTDIPNEGDEDQGGDGGEDDDNRNGRGGKGKKIQQNNQRNVPSKRILGFNWWDYFPRLQIIWGLRSATKDTSGEVGSHLVHTDTPIEGEKDQGGDGGDDDENHNGRGAKGKKIQQNCQQAVPSKGILQLNLSDDFPRLKRTRGLYSATRDTSGEGGSHLGGTDTPNEGDKEQGGDGGEDDDNRKGGGAKGKEIQHDSATRDTSGEGGSHLGGTNTPNEGEKDEGGDGGEDNDNRKGGGAKGKEIQHGSATRDTSGEGGSHLGGTNTPNEGEKDQGGDGGEHDDNRTGGGAKGKEIQHGSATRDTSGEGSSHLGGTDTPNEGEKEEGADGGKDDDNRKGGGAKGKEIQHGNATRDTSGEGGSHLEGTNTPNEGEKDQGSDGGEDDDNRKGRGGKGKGAKEREIQQNNQRDIRVTVETGHEHMVWNRNPEPEQLKKSHISPTLEFLFKKAENTIESNIQVKCCMNEKKSHQNSECFGWFQYEIHVTFKCSEPKGARPSKSELLGTEILKTTYTEQKETNPSQLTVEGKGGVPGIGSIKVGLSKTLASMFKLHQTMTETAHEFISGTRFRAYCADEGGDKPKSRYTFKLWPQVPTNKLPNGSDREKGMFCTVYPNFKVNWTVKSQGICKYELKVVRHVCELVLVARKWKIWGWKQNLSCHCDKMLQTYKVTLYINHDMSNIVTLPEFECQLHTENPKNKLVGLGVRPSSPASDEASSSTQ